MADKQIKISFNSVQRLLLHAINQAEAIGSCQTYGQLEDRKKYIDIQSVSESLDEMALHGFIETELLKRLRGKMENTIEKNLNPS